MQTITINKKDFRVSADMERVLRAMAHRDFSVLANFETGKGRNRSNDAVKAFGAHGGTAHKLGFAGDLGVELVYDHDAPKAAREEHPRAQRFVIVTNRRRLNTVLKKLAA